MGTTNSKCNFPTNVENSKRKPIKKASSSIGQQKTKKNDLEITMDFDFKAEDDIKSPSSLSDGYKLQLKAQPECDEVKCSEVKEGFLGMATISAPAYQKNERASMDCICVLDTSGSMDGGRISLVRKSVRRLVRGVQSQDRVAIVEFNTQIRVLLPLTAMDGNGKDRAMIIIKNMTATGGTNLSGGLLKGLELVKRRIERREVCSILLFTDGEANDGIRDIPGILRAAEDAIGMPKTQKTIPQGDPARWNVDEVLQWLVAIEMDFPNLVAKCQELKIDGQILMHDITEEALENDLEMKRIHWPKFLREVEKLREGDLGEKKAPVSNPLACTIHAFGYGTDHNSDLLTKLSRRFDGMYYYIKDGDAVKAGFATCLGGLMATVGTNIKLSMTPLNCKGLSILSDQSTTLNKKEIIVNIGDIQSEEERDIIFKFDLPKAKAKVGKLAYVDIMLTYTNTITKRSDTLGTRIVVIRGKLTTKRDLLLDAQNNRVITAKALTEADVLAKTGKMREARELLQRVIDEIYGSISGNNSISKTLISDLESTMKGYRTVSVYENWGQHFGQQVGYCHAAQRCANATRQPQYAHCTNYDVFDDFDRSCSQDSSWGGCFEDIGRQLSPPISNREASPPLSIALRTTPRDFSLPRISHIREETPDSDDDGL